MAKRLPVPVEQRAAADRTDQTARAQYRRAVAAAGGKPSRHTGATFKSAFEKPLSANTPRPAASRVAKAEPRVVVSIPHDPVPDPEPQPAAQPTETPSARPLHEDLDETQAFLRHLRRAWMSASFKRQPHTILTVKICPRLRDHTGGADRATAKALHKVFGELGATYWVGPATLALLVPGKSVRTTARIADAIRQEIDARQNDPKRAVRLVAGVAALHRDDDPVSAFLLAEQCLYRSEDQRAAAVVTEVDLRTEPPIPPLSDAPRKT